MYKSLYLSRSLSHMYYLPPLACPSFLHRHAPTHTDLMFKTQEHHQCALSLSLSLSLSLFIPQKCWFSLKISVFKHMSQNKCFVCHLQVLQETAVLCLCYLFWLTGGKGAISGYRQRLKESHTNSVFLHSSVVCFCLCSVWWTSTWINSKVAVVLVDGLHFNSRGRFLTLHVQTETCWH